MADPARPAAPPPRARLPPLDAEQLLGPECITVIFPLCFWTSVLFEGAEAIAAGLRDQGTRPHDPTRGGTRPSIDFDSEESADAASSVRTNPELAAEIARQGIFKVDLAAAIGCHPNSLTGVINGSFNPTPTPGPDRRFVLGRPETSCSPRCRHDAAEAVERPAPPRVSPATSRTSRSSSPPWRSSGPHSVSCARRTAMHPPGARSARAPGAVTPGNSMIGHDTDGVQRSHEVSQPTEHACGEVSS